MIITVLGETCDILPKIKKTGYAHFLVGQGEFVETVNLILVFQTLVEYENITDLKPYYLIRYRRSVMKQDTL